MSFTRLVVGKCAVALAVLIGFAPAANAAGWMDDFNDGSVTDGSPFTWSQDPMGIFPGDYDASSGDYFLKPNYATSPTQQNITYNNDVTFTDVYMRTQGVVLPGEEGNTDGNLVLVAHLDPETITLYILYFDVSHSLGLYGIAGGVPEIFDESVDIPDFNASSETIIELNIVGGEMRGFAWQPGQPKPADPQVVYTPLELPLASGKAGLAFGPDNDHQTSAIYRYMIAQDTPIIDALPGDYNEDGTVNAADYTVWRDGGSPDSTQAGYDLWVANFGAMQAGSGSSAAVPEPASIVCALLALVAVLRFRPAAKI